ncbi:MAG: NADH-quinone oxidoreductase subunit J [Myxococcota bacterium]
MSPWISFGGLGAAVLVSAVQAVRAREPVHAVLWLALVLLGTAGLYVALDAGFLAAVQVLLYTGGIVTLMLFAVLLVRATPEREGPLGTTGPLRALLPAAGLFAILAAAVLRTSLPGEPKPMADAKTLGRLIVGDLALPFEALSLLLLAAMIGAIVLARRKDP